MILLSASALLIFLLLIVHALLTSEKVVMRTLCVGEKSQPPRGLQQALDFCRAGVSGAAPELVVFPDTIPQALVIRALGKPGCILISQGLIVSFQDEEMVAVLRVALRRLSQRGIVWKSAATGWRARIRALRGGPMTPIRMMISWMLFPIEARLSRQERLLDVFHASETEAPEQAWRAALRKTSKVERLFS